MTTSEDENDLLIRALESGSSEHLKLALYNGAKVNCQSSDGRLAVHAAVAMGDAEAAKILLAAGANPMLPDSNNATAFDAAQQLNDDGVMTELLTSWLPRGAHQSSSQLPENWKKEAETVHKGMYGKVFTVSSVSGQTVIVKTHEYRGSSESRNEEEEKFREHENQGLEILASVKHRNLVQLLKSRLIDKKTFLICMEYVDGRTLNEIIEARQAGLSECEICDLCRQILHGLAFLHSHQPKPIVHRDIKCSNIIVSNLSIVKLIDFGLAAAASANQQSSTICTMSQIGSARYMAPELLDPDNDECEIQFRPSSDIWAFGCVVFHMAEGRLAFNGKNIPQCRREVCHKNTTPQLTNSSDALSSFCDSCLQKERGNRQTAVQLLTRHPFMTKERLDSIPEGSQHSPILEDAIRKLRIQTHLAKVNLGEVFDKLVPDVLKALEDNEETILKSSKTAEISKVSLQSIAVLGGSAAIVGAGLSIVTLGTGLPLLVVGSFVSIATTGGATAADVIGDRTRSSRQEQSQEKCVELQTEAERIIFKLLDSIIHLTERTVGAACPVRTVKILEFLRDTLFRLEVVEEFAKGLKDKDEGAVEVTNDLKMRLDSLKERKQKISEIVEASKDSPVRSSESVDEFHQTLEKAATFIIDVYTAMTFKLTDSQQSKLCLSNFILGGRVGTRVAAGVGEIALDATKLALRPVNIAFAGAFTLFDIGVLAHSAYRLHKIRGIEAERRAGGQKGDTGVGEQKSDTGAGGQKDDTGAGEQEGDTGAGEQKGDTGENAGKGAENRKVDKAKKEEIDVKKALDAIQKMKSEVEKLRDEIRRLISHPFTPRDINN